MNRTPWLLPALVFLALSISTSLAAEPVPPEYDTGRPRPPIAGFPVMGSGLSLSQGYYRGVPKGELAGWTVSLWFFPDYYC